MECNVVAVPDNLHPDEAKQQKEETDKNENDQCRNPVAELVEFAFAIVQARHDSEPSGQPLPAGETISYL